MNLSEFGLNMIQEQRKFIFPFHVNKGVHLLESKGPTLLPEAGNSSPEAEILVIF